MISTNPSLKNSNFKIDLSAYRPDIVEAIIASCAKHKEVSQHSTPYSQYKPWTNSEVEDLLNMFDQGRSTKEMSDKLHRTSGGIRGKLRRLGRLEKPNDLKKEGFHNE